MIIDWGLDLFNGSLDGTSNGHAPLTLGLTFTTGSSSSPANPGYGPSEEPDNPWNWWQGCWYANTYGFTVPSDISGALSANGRIDRRNPTDMSSSLYTKWWLVYEVDDVTLAWDTFISLTWWQFLTAPTGS